MAHTYTYNPLSGLSAGIPLTIGASVPSNPMRIAPPHLQLGRAGFIGVNTHWQSAHFVSGRLLHSSLTKIEPAEKRSFYVFDAPRQNDDFNSLIFIDTSVPKNMTRRPESDVDAWTGIRGEGVEVVRADTSTGTALLRCEANATIELFQFDGSVHLISVLNGKVSTVPLSRKQMAQYRVEQFREQIATLNLSLEPDVRRLHGIIAGAIRLVPTARDQQALDVLVDFFTDHRAQITPRLREDIRFRLLNANHPAAGEFIDGFEAVNVVKIQSADSASARAKAEQKRRARSEKDRQRTLATKNGGKGNSGGGQQQSAQKKGKSKK
jgi:hypothetical protein